MVLTVDYDFLATPVSLLSLMCMNLLRNSEIRMRNGYLRLAIILRLTLLELSGLHRNVLHPSRP